MPLYTPFGSSEGTITEGNDPRIPTQDETDALVGTSGTPSAINPYVTATGLVSLSLDNLSDVNISIPATNQVLQFNGMNWVNGLPINTSAGSGVVEYFLDIPQYGDVQLLSNTPSGAENIDTAVVVNADSPQPIDQYVTNGLHRTQLDAGIWQFDFYRYISAGGIDGITTITAKVAQNFLGTGTISISAGPGTSRTATVIGGTPFLLADADAGQLAASEISTPIGTFPIIAFTSSSVVTVQTPTGYVGESGVVYYVNRFLFNITTIPIVDIVVTLEEINTVQPVYTGFDHLDELFIKLYASTTSAISKTVDFVHQGNANFSHVHTPLITNHNDLAGLQGGIPDGLGEEYHLTLAAYTIATQAATNSVSGYLSSTDWSTFDSKQPSGSYITALTSDVSATGPGSVAATVNSVGTSSAANIHSAELAANAATNLNTILTIVKRDASGNFNAGTITASLTGHASLDKAITTGNAYKWETTNVSGNLQETTVTASRAIASDSDGLPVASATTATELGYVSGVTSAIQTQLDSKQPLDSDLTALASTITTGLYVITGVGTSITRLLTGATGQISIINNNGVAANPVIGIASNPIFPGTASETLVTGTMAQRPVSPVDGMLRFNSDLGVPEMYVDSTWLPISMAGARNFGTLFYDFIADSTVNDWNNPVSGTGAAVSSVNTGVNSTSRCLGVQQLTTGTTTTGRVAKTLSNTSILFGYGYHFLEWRVNIPTLSTAAQEFDAFIGFANNAGATGVGTNGIYFWYDRNTSINWKINCMNGGATTTVTTSTAISAGAWVKLGIEVNAAGTSATCYIDDTLVAIIATNIPVTTGNTCCPVAKIEKQAGITASLLLLDYVRYFYALTTSR